MAAERNGETADDREQFHRFPQPRGSPTGASLDEILAARQRQV
jgi:hypothetical protein